MKDGNILPKGQRYYTPIQRSSNNRSQGWKYQSFSNFGRFLNNKKRIFGPTKTLFGQTYKWPFLRISGRDHVLCHCGSFFMAQTVPPSLVNQSPKIRVLILAKLEWPEMAKNRGEPWKMTHSPVNFFNTKEVSHWFPDIRVPKVLLSPPKKWISIVNFQMFFQLV